MANVNSTLAVFELLTTCTKTKGYIARAAMPANDLAYAAYYATYKVWIQLCAKPSFLEVERLPYVFNNKSNKTLIGK